MPSLSHSSQLIIACRKGGTSIEDLAEKFPDMIVKVILIILIYLDPYFGYFYDFFTMLYHMTCLLTVISFLVKVPIDVFKGITDEDAAKVVDGLEPKVADRSASIEQVKKLYELFCKCDCTLLEVIF